MTRALPNLSTSPSAPRRLKPTDAGSRRRIASAPADVHAPLIHSPIEVRFALGRRAMARNDRVITPRGDAPLDLVFTLEPAREQWFVRAEIVDGGSRRSIAPETRLNWHNDRAANLWHIESPTIDATIELTEAGPRILFARSPLPARLGLAGGRYEVSGIALT